MYLCNQRFMEAGHHIKNVKRYERVHDLTLTSIHHNTLVGLVSMIWRMSMEPVFEQATQIATCQRAEGTANSESRTSNCYPSIQIRSRLLFILLGKPADVIIYTMRWVSTKCKLASATAGPTNGILLRCSRVQENTHATFTGWSSRSHSCTDGMSSPAAWDAKVCMSEGTSDRWPHVNLHDAHFIGNIIATHFGSYSNNVWTSTESKHIHKSNNRSHLNAAEIARHFHHVNHIAHPCRTWNSWLTTYKYYNN